MWHATFQLLGPLWPSVSQAGYAVVVVPALTLSGPHEMGPAFVDYDGDGDWDIISPKGNDGVRLLRNDGVLSQWTDVTAAVAPGLADPGVVRGVLVADLTHDGFPDLVWVETYEVRVFVHNGLPNAAYTVGASFPATSGSGFEGSGLLDHDGDGWLDVLVTEAEHANWILHNPANGSANLVPRNQRPRGMSTSTTNSDFATVADWDFDGDVDVIIRGEGTVPDAFLSVADTWTALAFDQPANGSQKGAAALCDVRGVGTFDLFWTEPVAPSVRQFVWDLGDWTETWRLGPWTPVHSVTCGDVDNDGAVDLWLSDGDTDDILYGPDLAPRPVGADGARNTFATGLADLDGDGDLDAYQVNATGSQLLENTGNLGPSIQVRPMVNVGTCPGGVVLRDDPGSTGRLLSATGEPLSALVEVSGGMGKGQNAWPLLHLGNAVAGAAHRVAIDFAMTRTQGPVDVALPAGVQRITIVHDDLDLDGIPAAVDQTPSGDLDGDGLFDWLDADADGDGLSDADENTSTDACVPTDTDGDGFPDHLDRDSDNDLLEDDVDPAPTDSDADDDGLIDGIDPDPLVDDIDGDTLLDGDEIAWNTDPFVADTDGGGRLDGHEVHRDGTDPTDPTDDLVDTDGDGITDAAEVALGTDPNLADTDVDGLSDGDEVYKFGTDPLNPDTDGDGLLDGAEVAAGSDPLVGESPLDTDGDGLSDEVESALGTDPTRVDTDGDGAWDGADPAPLDAGGRLAPPPTTTGCATASGPGLMPIWLACLSLALRRHVRFGRLL